MNLEMLTSGPLFFRSIVCLTIIPVIHSPDLSESGPLAQTCSIKLLVLSRSNDLGQLFMYLILGAEKGITYTLH